ncbi:hypothetical protein BBB56_16110 [Candidatus Pantoea deserta]|uniref:Uncharacterized protein n=1 Tax=Candidatus Pantoea deserta TaxID=1869313 RepID=A0A3N4P0K7_9GAMM|nr:hypothetical protein BBB56_16110 [Pantoea deserta]
MTGSGEQSVPRQRQKRRGVFRQRSALARLRAHLRDEVRIRAGRAGRDTVFASLRSGLVARVTSLSCSDSFLIFYLYKLRKKPSTNCGTSWLARP